jgi:hypothetical protein
MRLLDPNGCEVCHIDPATHSMYDLDVKRYGTPSPEGTFQAAGASLGPHFLDMENGETMPISITHISGSFVVFVLRDIVQGRPS